MPNRITENISDKMSEDIPKRITNDMPNRISENISDGMPERFAR